MPPYCDEHQMYFRMAYVDGSPFEQCVCVKCESGRLSGFDLAQSAIKATEPPSVAAADKGLILTEEELKLKERAFSTGVMPTWEFDQIISSHRTLNSRNAKLVHENDELMAEVMEYKNALEKLDSFLDFSEPVVIREWYVEDVTGVNQAMKEAYRLINPEQAAINEALEELNHE